MISYACIPHTLTKASFYIPGELGIIQITLKVFLVIELEAQASQ